MLCGRLVWLWSGPEYRRVMIITEIVRMPRRALNATLPFCSELEGRNIGKRGDVHVFEPEDASVRGPEVLCRHAVAPTTGQRMVTAELVDGYTRALCGGNMSEAQQTNECREATEHYAAALLVCVCVRVHVGSGIIRRR